jgi:hypothetical protein
VAAYEAAAERMTDREILASLATYLWPKGNSEFKGRIAAALGLLVASKLLTVQVPFFFKHAVDALAADPTGGAPAAALWGTLQLGPAAALVGYGAARAGAAFCGEVRNVVFAKVSQSAIRSVANDVFARLLALDLGFHLSRQTGALNRVIDRCAGVFWMEGGGWGRWGSCFAGRGGGGIWGNPPQTKPLNQKNQTPKPKPKTSNQQRHARHQLDAVEHGVQRGADRFRGRDGVDDPCYQVRPRARRADARDARHLRGLHVCRHAGAWCCLVLLGWFALFCVFCACLFLLLPPNSRAPQHAQH